MTRPIAFAAGRGAAAPLLARPGEGMQKEALVGTGATLWNLLCDEGPTLNGTDAAPFPLGYFAAGLATAVMVELSARTAATGTLAVDTLYTLNGSFSQRTMVGSALSPRITWSPSATVAGAQGLLSDAVLSAPALALARAALPGVFAATLDNTPMIDAIAEPMPRVDRSFTRAADGPALIEKVATAEGARPMGASLVDSQARTIHVAARCSLHDEALVAEAALVSPAGSTFRMIADPEGVRAPAPFDYVAAGLAFCFMTQLSRYAHIARLEVPLARLVQVLDAWPAADGQPAACTAPKTWLAFEGGDAQVLERSLAMAEQTCFLHAFCRTALRPRLAIAALPRRADTLIDHLAAVH